MSGRGVARAVAALVGSALVLASIAGCGGGPRAVPPADNSRPAPVYVALGGDETAGVGATHPLVGAWPQLFYRDGLPADAIFVNAGTRRATVADGLRDQLPLAVSLHPTIVTVWFGAEDLTEGVAPATFEGDLRRLVDGLRSSGVQKVLLADTVDAYRDATARVASGSGATLVDVGAAAGTGAALDDAGHQRAAAAFVAAAA
jgi:lysophospholipase L1-like esterase